MLLVFNKLKGKVKIQIIQILTSSNYGCNDSSL